MTRDSFREQSVGGAKLLLGALLFISGGALAGRAHAHSRSPHATQKCEEEPPQSVRKHAGVERAAATVGTVGDEGDVSVGVEVDSVNKASSAEQLELEVRASTARKGKRVAQLARFVVDSRGNIFGDTSYEPAQLFDERGETTWSVTTPDGLPDGHYKLRILLLTADENTQSAREIEYPFSIDAKRISTMSSEEWYSLREVNEGRPVEEAKK